MLSVSLCITAGRSDSTAAFFARFHSSGMWWPYAELCESYIGKWAVIWWGRQTGKEDILTRSLDLYIDITGF